MARRTFANRRVEDDAISSRRRITLLDLLILVAATAVGLALLRVCMSVLTTETLSNQPGALIRSYIIRAESYAVALLAPWSVALLVLSLRRPRLPFARLARGPGFIACAAATSGMAIHLTLCLAQFLRIGRPTLNAVSAWSITHEFVNNASMMIAGSWLTLALGARWRRETNWVGWAGRILGLGWIGLFLLRCARAVV
jgi:hypothetical protein